MQTITVVPDFNYFVTFPADVTIEGCASDISIDMVGEPIVSGVTCAQVGINVEDQEFTIQSGSCIRVHRTYTVKNTCLGATPSNATDGGIPVAGDPLKFQDDGDGFFRFTQTIDIIDNEAPRIFTDENQSFESDLADCTGIVNIDIVAADNCTSALDYVWTIDVFGNGTNDMFGTNGFISGVLPVGSHTGSISVSDGCGNTTTRQLTITVTDEKKPTPFCLAGINTVIMNGDARSIDVWANDLIQLGSSFDNCTNNEDIIVSVAMATDPNPSVAPTATSVLITCDDLDRDGNDNAIPTTFSIQVFVQDEAGNFNFCTTEVEVIDTGNDCGTTATGSAQISGRIFNENNEDVEDVTVQVDNNSQPMSPVVTQTDGTFVFSDLTMHDDYSVCLLYTSPSPRDGLLSRMPSSA